MSEYSKSDVREFVVAYLECALWSSTTEEGTSFENEHYDTDDIAPVTKRRMMRDCLEFIEENSRKLEETGAAPDQHGHDFWLTRNRHGAGFWDRGYSRPLCRALTDAAHGYGAFELYAGDDGKVYGS